LLSDRCVDVLDVQAAGVMLVSPAGELRVVASSSSLMRGLELFEEQFEEGPCPDCYRTGSPVVNAKIAATDTRWPHFAPKALAAGFRSAHALPLRLRDLTIGALNLFRTDEGELTPGDVVVAQGFADVATLAILQNRTVVEAQRLNEQLTDVLHARIAIEQAKGVLSARTGLDMEQCFSLLRNHAANHHVRLVDLAHTIVDGTVDPGALDPLN
jgi:GAF domain-containing protein